MATKRVRTKPPSTLSPEQKVAFALLMFLGVGGVVFGAQSFGANLMRPIQEQIAQLYTGEKYVTQSERQAQELEESKTKDTDNDGLVDYDELYVYKTSPYLADSDSDGYDDKQEIYSGNNPNCPHGKTCGFITSSAEETGDSGTVEAFIEGVAGEQALQAGAIDFSSEEEIAEFFKQATMEEVRAALVEAGMSEEELAQIDDETLEAFFYGALDEASIDDLLEGNVTPTE